MKHRCYIILGVLVLAVLGLALFWGCAAPVAEEGARAAIVDQLYTIQPNPLFTNTTVEALEAYGFEVDVYQGDEITVDFYRKLPTPRYKLVIFRVHSGLLIKEGEIEEGTWLFTSESFNRMKYTYERLNGRIVKARIVEANPWVFAIGSEFVTHNLEGQFDSTVVIAMGCYCFYLDDLARAFVEQGASAYLGWDGNVGLGYVDQATINLIDNLCSKGMTIEQAVDKTMAEIGPDPDWGAQLKHYPVKSGDMTIKELTK